MSNIQIRENLTSAIQEINWADLEDVRKKSRAILNGIAGDRHALTRLLHDAAGDPDLRPMFEHYDILDKIVLFNDPTTGARLRLHIFLPGYFDRPHNHRWAYTTQILHGSYEHYIYIPQDFTDKNAIEQMSPSMISTERVGSSYTYDDTLFHSIIAQPYTVSLILRGPSQKDKFLVVDKLEKTAWWQFGAIDELKDKLQEKQMDDARFRECVDVLRSRSIVDTSEHLAAG